MKKLNFIVPCVCLLVLLFSCKKDTTDPTPQEMNKDVSFTKTSFATAVVQDTVPPSNAVSVKTYGAAGNGSTDDTKAIQNAINAQANVFLPKGTYIINQTLSMRSGVRIYGTNGAIIKAGASITGALLSQGTFFSLKNVSKSWITNIRFQPSASKAFTIASWANSAILLDNSSQNDVKYNFFDFKQPYATNGIEGIWVTDNSSNNYIGYNTMNTVGFVYEAGASNNIFIRNTITNAHYLGIAGYGNSTTACSNNQLLNNTITNSGYMGITDFKNCNATYIAANYITGTGKSNLYGDSFGISAVGVNTVITLNTLTDCQNQYIEVGGNSKTITHNTINDVKGIADGFLVNVTAAAGAGATVTTTTIDHNTINGCNHAVAVIGNYNPSVSITNNSINNPFCMGVYVNSNATSYNIAITGNIISLTKPNNQSRVAIGTYATAFYAAQQTTIGTNTITYATSAAGGLSTDYALLPRTNNVKLLSNTITANNIKNKQNSLVIGISASANKYTGYTITNNKFSGAYEDLSGYIGAILSGNIL